MTLDLAEASRQIEAMAVPLLAAGQQRRQMLDEALATLARSRGAARS